MPRQTKKAIVHNRGLRNPRRVRGQRSAKDVGKRNGQYGAANASSRGMWSSGNSASSIAQLPQAAAPTSPLDVDAQLSGGRELSLRFFAAINGGVTFVLRNNGFLSRTNHSLAHTSVHAAAYARAVSRPRCIECERSSP